MTPWVWPWMSYRAPCWDWPVDEVGEDYFDDEEALEQAIFDVAVRRCLGDLENYFPDRRLLSLTNELRRTVEAVQADLVAEERAGDRSWTRIGTALGVGRTAAQKRYGRGLSEERQDQLEQEAQAAMEWARDVVEDTADREADLGGMAVRTFLERITARREKK